MTPVALVQKLKANTTLASKVSGRIWPIRAPQNALRPYITYQRIAAQPIATLGEATGNQFDLVQFSIFGDEYTQVEEAALALVGALDGVTLSTGDNATLQDRRDFGWDDVAELYRQDADFLI